MYIYIYVYTYYLSLKSWPCHIVTIHIFSNTRPNCILQLATFEPHAASGSLAGSGAWPSALQLICAAMAQRQQNVVIYGSWGQSYGEMVETSLSEGDVSLMFSALYMFL